MQLLNPLSSGGWACALRRVLSWPVLLPLLIALVLSAAPGARAQDPATAAVVLVMVEDPGCPYCARWTAEIEPGYVRSAEGRFAPLVRRLRDAPDIAFLRNIVYSPTFVVLKSGVEVGRIVGYSGPDLFWMQIADLLAKAGFRPAPPPPAERRADLSPAR